MQLEFVLGVGIFHVEDLLLLSSYNMDLYGVSKIGSMDGVVHW